MTLIFDILFTTDNEQIINNTYTDELVTAYDVPKPSKKPNLTDEDLYTSDTFSFGQQIGQITNLSTAIYAMLPLYKEGTPEYDKLICRLKQCCVNQSKQIDKTKIGRAVKAIPKIWNTEQKIEPGDDEATIAEKEFNNSIVVKKKPYFFKYKYKTFAKEIKDFVDNQKEMCSNDSSNMQGEKIKTFEEIIATPESEQTEYEKTIVKFYKEKYPAIDTKCIMNNVAHHIESIDFSIKQKIRTSSDFDYHTLMSSNVENNSTHERINQTLKNTFEYWQNLTKTNKVSLDNKTKVDKKALYAALQAELLEICPIEETLSNHLVEIFYNEHQTYNKSTLWAIAGKQIFENIKKKTKSFYFPIKDENGSLEYLYEKYQINKIELPSEEVDTDNMEDIFDKLQENYDN